MEYMEQYSGVNAGQPSSGSSTVNTTGSTGKRKTTSRPSSPVLRREEVVKEETPEPELDEVSLSICFKNTQPLSRGSADRRSTTSRSSRTWLACSTTTV